MTFTLETVETATIDAEIADFYARYDREPVTVKCKICRSSETASRRELELGGWMLVGRGEFCPKH